MWSRFEVADHSMEPALQPGDMIEAGPVIEIERGDIVIFPHPRYPDMMMVKRVVGLPGESIALDTGEVVIDGVAGIDLWGHGLTLPDGEWELNDREVFVLSDNRESTRDDSRNFGGVLLETCLLADPVSRR
ncbi:MAG TPA: signal peptidase I [Acidimicrobiia bacterium]|jgi:signal peptidase I